MELLLSSELDAKLSRLAAEQGRDSGALVIEAVERLVNHEAWIMAEVDKGVEAAERGEMVDHEAVGMMIDRRFPS